jgi:prepilin-type N-terminal cleavage/methylation domain-containing protein
MMKQTILKANRNTDLFLIGQSAKAKEEYVSASVHEKNKDSILIRDEYKGFSLIELSIAMAIIGALLVSGFNVVNGNNNLNKKTDTQRRMKIIEKAIAAFVNIYDRLPCPGDITLPNSNTNSGVEYCNTSASSYLYNVPSVPTSPTNYIGINNYVKIGSVPYIALKLPKEYVSDAWGNNFIYAVTLSMAGTSTSTYGTPTTVAYLESANMGLIKVIDSQNSTRSNNAAYVLMSTGDNGYGGYPRASSTRNATPTDAKELQNYQAACATSSTNCATFAALEQTSTYDDIVHFKQKWQVVKEAGYVLSNNTCTLAKDTINTADSSQGGVYYDFYCSHKALDPKCPIFFSSFIYKIRELCINQY